VQVDAAADPATVLAVGFGEPGAAAYDVALLDIFWATVNGILHGLALARAEGIPAGEIAPYAQAMSGMFPEMTTRFAHQIDEASYPGDRSTLASAASSLDHILHTAAAHGLDTTTLTATKAVLQRALDAGHGADGLARLAETLTTPAG
jgi:3-hydroxyisobutyrate dehydrogenase-like beta-hydroxyacid dehydrogenase